MDTIMESVELINLIIREIETDTETVNDIGDDMNI